MTSSTPSVSIVELRGLLDRGAATFYDVRRRVPFESSGEAIPSASWRDPDQVESWSRHIAPGCLVVVTCIHGHEVSQNTAAALRTRGLDGRYLEGGFDAWRAAGGV